MKVLLVNNHTEHLESLRTSLAGHEIELVEYRPGVTFNDQDKDLVILSGGGGEGLEITDKVSQSKLWYDDEMDFVRQTTKPVLGICMGFEVIVRAHGGQVHYRPELIMGFRPSHLTTAGQKFLNHKVINQLEAHYWHVPEVPARQLEVLARSESGIEMVHHKQKKQLGTQFHPESAGGTLQLRHLIQQFVAS